MRTTVFLEDAVLQRAKEITGLEKTSQIINTALNDFVKRQERLRLAKLGGTYKNEELAVPRRRSFESID